jgi:hypothetical protein
MDDANMKRTRKAKAAKRQTKPVKITPIPVVDTERALALMDRERALANLEPQICDLERAAHIAFLMLMHEAENSDEEGLAMVAVEHVEQLASELRASFALASEGKAVRT